MPRSKVHFSSESKNLKSSHRCAHDHEQSTASEDSLTKDALQQEHEKAGPESVLQRGRRNSTLLFRLARSKVPEYLQEPYVFSYYRREGLAYYQCCRSLFRLHNETFNCWTHYVGFVLFVSLAISVMCGGTPLPSLQVGSGPHLSDSVTAHRIHLQLDQLSAQLHAAAAAIPLPLSRSKLDLVELSTPAECSESTSGVVATTTMGSTGETAEDALEDQNQDVLKVVFTLTHLHQQLATNVSHVSQLISEYVDELKFQFGTDLSTLLEKSRAALHTVEEDLATRRLHLAQELKTLGTTIQANLDQAKELSAKTIETSVVFIEELGDTVKTELGAIRSKLTELPAELPARWPLVVYLIGVSITLLCSATFHTFMCCGRNAYNNFARLDYAGVSVQIVASVLVIVFYSFREPHQIVWRYIYLAALLVIGLTLLTVMCLEYFAAWRQLRTVLFVLIGAFGLVPVAHLAWQLGVQDPFVGALLRGTAYRASSI
eukprot:CAMPEP_0177649734 /NCGR_PEP_ID=MMETSP0447-20121125/11553_1 /TAXON_ID=0 /ORGANISM="Stygamoeba regulata, Strain BSH-02190019" /LENGTH=487 /DNA_ID=CAMNT_0019152529 /DNA_START=257 /DNA_END=1721 /DNA_ORIENTATION=-